MKNVKGDLFRFIGFHINFNQLPGKGQSFHFQSGSCWELFFINRVPKPGYFYKISHTIAITGIETRKVFPGIIFSLSDVKINIFGRF